MGILSLWHLLFRWQHNEQSTLFANITALMSVCPHYVSLIFVRFVYYYYLSLLSLLLLLQFLLVINKLYNCNSYCCCYLLPIAYYSFRQLRYCNIVTFLILFILYDTIHSVYICIVCFITCVLLSVLITFNMFEPSLVYTAIVIKERVLF